MFVENVANNLKIPGGVSVGKLLSKLYIIVWMAAILIVPVNIALAAQAGPVSPIPITVLAVNDFHGAIIDEGKNPGIIRLGKYLKDEKAINPTGTVILSAGDMFQGSAESNLLYGKPVIEAMNNIGFDAMVVGNHEFDWGLSRLGEQAAASHFPYLGANVVDRASGKLLPFLHQYIITEKNGIKIAIIGLATPETEYKSNPKIVSRYDFIDPVKTVNTLVPMLKGEGAQIIIVLSHLGCELDEAGNVIGEAAEFAKRISGVDLIITGHSHKKILGKINGIPIVQAYCYGRAAVKASFLFSLSDNKIVSSIISSTDIAQYSENDKDLAAIVENANKEVSPLKNTVLGTAEVELYHNREELSLFGQWITDRMRQKVNADIAFENGGGLRRSLPAGRITMGNLYEAIPFDNTLCTVDLTGSQIIRILEQGIGDKNYGMLQFSGLKVHYDSSKPSGKQLISVTLLDGEPLRSDKLYKVVTNDFMAAGGDGFSIFNQGKNANDSGILLREIVADALKGQQVIRFTGDCRLKDESSLRHKAAA